jgi:hypothetical protein
MKYKLKDIDFINDRNIKYSLGLNNTNYKLINFTYLKESFEFQTPKVLIEKLIKENNKEYLLLKILPTEACKTFCKKILEFENKHNIELNKHKHWFNKNISISLIKSVFNEDCFIVKVPFKGTNPQIKIYDKDSNLFNYYLLKEGMEIICLLNFSNIWINFDNTPSYNLIIKEILITKIK